MVDGETFITSHQKKKKSEKEYLNTVIHVEIYLFNIKLKIDMDF